MIACSYRLFKYIAILFMCVVVNGVMAQNRFFNIKVRSLEGAVAGCLVVLPQLDKWSVSDSDGCVIFENIPQGIWQIEGRLVGYTCRTKEIIVEESSTAEIYMEEESYQLEDVTITAKSGAIVGTSSVIDRTALEHQQTLSIVDALQLIPGQVTQNPSLASASVMTIRETDTDNATSAIGTAIVIDGANYGNDANLQQMSTSSVSTTSMPKSAGTGVDVRSISTDCVESVEVVRGVASAEYGDLTSGVVLVNSRAGFVPLTIMLKTDPRLKSASIGKGVRLNNRGGAMSGNVDFAISKEDERISTRKFQRITGQVAYSDNYEIGNSRMMFNLKLNGHLSKNINDSDPDMLAREYVRMKDNLLSVNLSARWLINKKYLTSARFVAYSSIGHQVSETLQEYIANMPTPYTHSIQSGEYEGDFYPLNYDEICKVDGRPINVQIKASAIVSSDWQMSRNMITYGFEWNAKGNKGGGKTGQYLATGYRPRSFSNIPFIFDYSFFAEDHYHIKIATTALDLQIGARITGIRAEGYDFDFNIDPRINASFSIVETPKQHLKLRGAWGIQTKLPTLTHLYPDPAYLDKISYTYVDNDNTKNKSIFTSLCVNNTGNSDLKYARSTNAEIGIDTKLWQSKIDITYFREKLCHGYSFGSVVEPLSYKVYNQTIENAEYVDGKLQLQDGTLVPSYVDTTFLVYNRPQNAVRIDKWGIEYNVDIWKVKSINTQFIIDGAYYDIERSTDGTESYYTSTIIDGRNRKYAAMAISRSSTYNTSHNRRLNSNLRIITHIPKIGLVCSLKGQCVWMDKSAKDCLLNGHSIVEKSDDGTYYVSPLALISQDGTIISKLPDDLLVNSQTKDYVKKIGVNALLEDNPKPYAMFDIRITKEFGKNLLISFYVNNFTNSRPKRYLASSDMNVTKNTEIYFGCDMKLKF